MGLTASQRKQLRRALEGLLTSVSARPVVRIEPNRTDEAEVGRAEDEQPLNEMLQAIASNRNRSSDRVLERTRQALERLKSAPEDAGCCHECGEDIPWARLQAMPFAELCVGCQGKRDGPTRGPTRRGTTDFR
jgi:DnaK suppressor protein